MSTIKVTNLRHGSATSDNISLDSSGNVSASGNLTVTGSATLNGLAYPSAGPLSNRNLIINGAMQVAQRGTSSTASDYATVDRFSAQFSSGSVTQTQENLSSGDPYDQGFRYFLRQTNTTAASATDSGERKIRHYIEAQNVAGSGWNYASTSSYITLSFWVRSSVAQEFYGYLRSNDGTNQAYGFSTGSLTANTWTKVTKTVPGNSNLEFADDNGAGLELDIAAFFGTNYTDSGYTLDAWAAFSNSSRSPDYTTTWATTTDATFDVTGVQLEVGSVATPFEHRSYSDELARCQRYFCKNGEWAVCQAQSAIDNITKGNSVNFPVTMRATPGTITLYDIGGTSGQIHYQVRSAGGSNIAASIVNSSSSEFNVRKSASANEEATMIFRYEASAEL